ncbi:MAG TPA: hypothetical protein VMY37_21120 [Thermoguttaceae bacterium]|nr:hypothetical protein [Thermoguttaceae bacterium]
MHAALLAFLVVTGAGVSTSAPEELPAPAPTIMSTPGSDKYVQEQSGACTHGCPCDSRDGWATPLPLPSGYCPRYGWSGKRWTSCYPSIYDRMPYDYRRSFDYPWDMAPRRAACGAFH